MSKKVVIIGAGFSSLAAACYLARDGFDVSVIEKNKHLGGRSRQLKSNGFTFDMGPTFYWMPDVFESFFKDFNKKQSDFYELIRLDPGYKVVFKDDIAIDISANLEEIYKTFDQIEPGSSEKLKKFLSQAKSNYELAIQNLVYQPGISLLEIITPQTALKLNLFLTNIKSQASKVVENENLRKILEFPVLFLGAKSKDTPAFYNFMNYADFGLGTWHVKGGMSKVSDAMVDLARTFGVQFITETAVTSIKIENKKATQVLAGKQAFDADIVLSGADYVHTETLLPAEHRQYSPKYWENKKFAPSALLYFVGFGTKIEKVAHHTLFFDSSFEEQEHAIYDQPRWLENPLFYVNFSSKTDATFAPADKEAATILIPVAPGLETSDAITEKVFENIILRLEKFCGQQLADRIEFKQLFSIENFVEDYNSYKGNAYGLANTLLQTHILRPNLKSKFIENLYFTGQLTVPGPGVPPSLISGKIVSALIKKHLH